MIKNLYLPELREMLASERAEDLREFCTALHPSRIAGFLDGLSATDIWRVLKNADETTREQIFSYLDTPVQIEILENEDRDEVAALIAELWADDRVDILNEIDDKIADDLVQRVPFEERRNIMRLRQYREGTAGSVMTTDFVALSENLTVRQALDELTAEHDEYETIYYLYIVDEVDHLRGVVSARQLMMHFRKADTPLSELMETDLIAVRVTDSTEEVAEKVANIDVLAIPVLDAGRHMVGIITHDDIIDVVREEALEDAYRSAAVDPLDESYLQTGIFTLSWKRGIWLGILFFCALLTAFALQKYETKLARWAWLVPFIPLVISSGGNTGSQSATLIITALARGQVSLSDWWKIVAREIGMGAVLGAALALLGFLTTITGIVWIPPNLGWSAQAVVPLTLFFVVISGTLTGSILPLVFQRLGLDPAIMSNPFVAGIVDILGIVIYMTVAGILLVGN